MYYYFKGELVHLEQNIAVVECGGVAYKLSISYSTYKKLSGEQKQVKLYSYLNVREDALDLFGFFNQEEQKSFKQLISVSGVGPKVALAIFSELTPEQFAASVVTNDAKTISRANGVGPKLAQRIILELRDKISNEQITSNTDDNILTSYKCGNNITEAINALCVLGYSRQQATSTVKSTNPTEDSTVEDIIRNSLKQLM